MELIRKEDKSFKWHSIEYAEQRLRWADSKTAVQFAYDKFTLDDF